MNLKEILVQDFPLIFSNSVLILDGTPFFILQFNEKKAECLNIGSQNYVQVDFDKVKSVEMPNTGYLNHRGVCAFITRTPCRRYKHGLAKDNITVGNGGFVAPKEAFDKVRDALDTAQRLTGKSLYNTYMNIYPSLEQAIEMFQDGCFVVAFDRQFAITNSWNILYKDKNVGVLNDKHQIVFNHKYNHLKISLPKGLQ